MTAKFSLKQYPLVAFLIPIILILSLVTIVNSDSYSNNHHTLSTFIVIDFIVTIPLIYFLLIRKTRVSNLTIAPFLILSVIMASYIIPSEDQSLLNTAKFYVIPIVELSILTIVILKVRKAILAYRLASEDHHDFYTILQKTCASLFPKTAAKLVANEIALIYFGFFNFKAASLKDNEFSNYKGSGILSTLGAIIFIVAIEMVTVHYFASKWHLAFAWILTGLSIYSAFQLIGIIRSVPKRPLQILDDTLVLRFGILTETKIPIEAIDRISFANFSDIEKNKNTKTLSLFGELEQINTVIYLKTPQQIEFIYGRPKTYDTLLLFIDNNQDFRTKVEQRISK